MRVAPFLILIALAGPALADEPMEVVPGGGPRCLDPFPGAAEESGLSPYFIDPLGPGFVAYATVSRAEHRALWVVENCGAGEAIFWSGPDDRARWPTAAGLSLWDEMIHGAEEVTLADMAARLRALGETTELRRVAYESCGCRMLREL
jgi:hypothetical protein